MSHPEFVDNREGNTLEAALSSHLRFLAENLREPVRVAIATGYFNPEGFARIADELESTGGVRLLLGAEPIPPPARPERQPLDPRGDRFDTKLTTDALRLNEQGLRRDRDLLPFDPGTDRAVRRLLEFLSSSRLEVRRYEKQFLHGKAYLFSHAQGAIAGSSNFTAAGLTSNLELNLGQYQPAVVSKVEQWFEDLWAEAVPYDLAALYEARYAEYPPYLVYLRVLWERYAAELQTEAAETGAIHLTSFQRDGLDRARRMLDRYHGVLIADSVGLGKTFMAGSLLDEVINRRRQRALLIAPAALRDGTWARFRSRFQLGVEVRSFEEVMQDKQVGGDRKSLDAKVNEYALIVIDEAHAYRHADTRRAQALRRLLLGDPPKHLVLMTATPVNNSLWDLYELLTYFVGHDSVFADAGIPSLKERFDVASRIDPLTLKPDVLFDVLDATTVRRTRHFVKRYYANDTIRLPDGSEVTIQFPKPHVRSVSYDLEQVLPGFFEEVTEILAPEDGHARLTMARYWPSKYRRGGQPDAREAALVGLIRSGLLKRFESSAHAFALTLGRMITAHDNFLKGLKRGVILGSDELVELEETDSDEAWEALFEYGAPIGQNQYDLEALRAAVAGDRTLLKKLHDRAVTVTPKKDPKLELLVEELVAILRASEEEGATPEQHRDRRKVLIFSYFADSVRWIQEFLRDRLATDHRLAPYRGRLAALSGTESYDDVGRQHAIYGFAPRSMEAPPALDDDKYDILVTTDILSEGMNLQQAARIINYDLPWNPMRLVQRHGRIDRIGSPHRDVHMTCIFPDRQLDRLLDLEQRIRRKLAQAAASVGLDGAVIPGAATSEHVFADTIEDIKALRREDADIFETAGEDVNAHSGEEYRQELRKALERYERAIKDLPGAAGSGLVRGTTRGHFFCARVFGKVLLRFVTFHGGEMLRDSLGCLRLVTCNEGTPRVMPEDLASGAYDAWARARRDIFEEWQKGSDPKNLQPDIRPLFRKAAEHVRGHRPADMTLEEVDRLAEALEAPRGLRIEKSLREVFTPETAEGERTTKAIAERVKLLGLQPWKAPEPLPPIDEDEVQLVVWMAVEQEGEPPNG